MVPYIGICVRPVLYAGGGIFADDSFHTWGELQHASDLGKEKFGVDGNRETNPATGKETLLNLRRRRIKADSTRMMKLTLLLLPLLLIISVSIISSGILTRTSSATVRVLHVFVFHIFDGGSIVILWFIPVFLRVFR
jgi:hypothetical protein